MPLKTLLAVAGSVDAKLIIVLESVKLVVPIGWLIFSSQHFYSNILLAFFYTTITLTNFQATIWGYNNSRMLA